jgi:hypothetical protein
LSTQEPPPELPEAEDIVVSSVASLVNLAGVRLTDVEHKNPAKAKEAAGPIRDALSQVQMLYVREQGSRAEQGEPAEPRTSEEEERAKARAKIWTPGSP